MTVSIPTGPVADFCAALRDLQRSSGLSRPALAKELNYGRSQLYDILDGKIKRPPEWDKLVEPLLRVCLAGTDDRGRVERAVADWRLRHEVLVRVCEELSRRGVRGVTDLPIPTRSASQGLVEHSERLWPLLVSDPFVLAVARGELSDDLFRRWLVNDHYYNVEYQRFIAGLAASAPSTSATEAIASGVTGMFLGLTQIRQLAARFHIDLDVEPTPSTVGFAAFLQAQLNRGYSAALAALYASERVYFDAWSAVRPIANPATPYWHLIENWSSESYGHWIAGLGRMVDATAPAGPSPEMCRAFDLCIRFELRFWKAIREDERW